VGRRLRWLVAIVVVLLIGGAVYAVLTVQPDLSDTRDRVDAAWTPLRAPLATRYTALAKVASVLHAADEGDRTITVDLDRTLSRWQKLALRGDAHTDAGEEASVANDLEALARRVRANILGSDRLKTNQLLSAALQAYDQAVVPVPALDAYNAAVARYQSERSGSLHHLVATVMGFDERPRLLVGG